MAAGVEEAAAVEGREAAAVVVVNKFMPDVKRCGPKMRSVEFQEGVTRKWRR
jgi:hypothetical protein